VPRFSARRPSKARQLAQAWPAPGNFSRLGKRGWRPQLMNAPMPPSSRIPEIQDQHRIFAAAASLAKGHLIE